MPDPQEVSKSSGRAKLAKVSFGVALFFGLLGVAGIVCETIGSRCQLSGLEDYYSYAKVCMLLSALCFFVNLALSGSGPEGPGESRGGQEGGSP